MESKENFLKVIEEELNTEYFMRLKAFSNVCFSPSDIAHYKADNH